MKIHLYGNRMQWNPEKFHFWDISSLRQYYLHQVQWV